MRVLVVFGRAQPFCSVKIPHLNNVLASGYSQHLNNTERGATDNSLQNSGDTDVFLLFTAVFSKWRYLPPPPDPLPVLADARRTARPC